MLLAIIFYNVWGVLQLVAIGSFARTLRVRTVLAAIAVGLFFCAPLTALLEYTWAAAIAALTDRPIEAVITVTAYTLDPPVEEIVRILPLALLLLVPVIRRQLSVTDCVLIGAAAGAGFGLAEDLYRFGNAPQHAVAVTGGWLAPFQSPVISPGSGRFFIPSITTAMGGWLPDIGGVRLFAPYMLPNLLLIWSAVAGLAVGLWLRLDGPRRWYAAAALLAYASGAHAAYNADITFGRELLVTAPFRALAGLQTLMPVAALAIAWWIDRRRQADVLPEHLLALERENSPRALGAVSAAVARMPESIGWIDGFVRLRRAYNAERSSGGAEPEDMRNALAQLRDHFDDQLLRRGSWGGSTTRFRHQTRLALRDPRTVLYAVMTLPCILWFGVGGWPATSGLQGVMSTAGGNAVVVAICVLGQVWIAWRLYLTLATWRATVSLPVADAAARTMLRVCAAAGALGFGAHALLRSAGVWGISGPAGVAHALDAVRSMPIAQGASMATGGPITLYDGWQKDYGFQPTQAKYDPIKHDEAWKEGYNAGKDGRPGMSKKDAPRDWQNDYDRGYEAGRRHSEAQPRHDTVRPSRPGEWIGSRDIYTVGPDGLPKWIHVRGTESQLDMRQAYETEKMRQAVFNGFLRAAGGLGGAAGRVGEPRQTHLRMPNRASSIPVAGDDVTVWDRED